MKKFYRLIMLPAICLLLVAILSCSKDEAMGNSALRITNATTVTENDMLGHWDLTAMMADIAVDLNSDNRNNKNLLDETNCFNTMSITFNEDGTFISNNAQMTFESGSSNKEFSCLTDRLDNGNWKVRNDSLILEVEIKAETYTHKKLINMGANEFSLEVNKIESKQYVNDPGDTQASPIRVLEVAYTKS